jgi:integrase
LNSTFHIALFRWAIGEGLADNNPVAGTNLPLIEVARDRVLSDTELASIWRHAGDGDYGAILKLLMLTGQRRDEVASMQWQEIDLEGRTLLLPGARTKNHREHQVPLSDPAIAILRALPRRPGREFVFGSGNRGFYAFSYPKIALDKRLGKIDHWRLHDLRRTVATRLSDFGVAPHIVETLLNHVGGFRSGVSGVYNKSRYGSEVRDAIDLWAKHVAGIVGMQDA